MSTNEENEDFSVSNSDDEINSCNFWQNTLVEMGLDNITEEYVDLSSYLDHSDNTTILDWTNWDDYQLSFDDDTNGDDDDYQLSFDDDTNGDDDYQLSFDDDTNGDDDDYQLSFDDDTNGDDDDYQLSFDDDTMLDWTNWDDCQLSFDDDTNGDDDDYQLSFDDDTMLDWTNWDDCQLSFDDDTNGDDADYQLSFDALMDSESVETETFTLFNFQDFGWNQLETDTTNHWYCDNVVVEQFLIDEPDNSIDQFELECNLIQDNDGDALALIGVLPFV